MTLALPVGAGTEICNLVSRQHAGRLSHPTRQNNQPRYAADGAGYSRNLLRNQFEELEAKQVSQVGYGRRAWHRGRMGELAQHRHKREVLRCALYRLSCSMSGPHSDIAKSTRMIAMRDMRRTAIRSPRRPAAEDAKARGGRAPWRS